MLSVDSVYNLINFQIVVTPILTIDDFSNGLIIAFGISNTINEQVIGELFDKLEQVMKNNNLEMNFDTVILDSCDSCINYFDRINKNIQICRFHFIKAVFQYVEKEHSDDETIAKIKGLIYRLIITRNENEYTVYLDKMHNVFSSSFYNYFIQQWDSKRYMETNE